MKKLTIELELTEQQINLLLGCINHKRHDMMLRSLDRRQIELGHQDMHQEAADTLEKLYEATIMANLIANDEEEEGAV